MLNRYPSVEFPVGLVGVPPTHMINIRNMVIQFVDKQNTLRSVGVTGTLVRTGTWNSRRMKPTKMSHKTFRLFPERGWLEL